MSARRASLAGTAVAVTLLVGVPSVEAQGYGFITKWGSKGSGNGQFEWPHGIATDAAGNVYVTDYEKGRVQKFTSTGRFIRALGSYGTGAGQFVAPTGVAVDRSGSVYVVDEFLDSVQKLTADGGWITSWPVEPDSSQSIAVDGTGNVYVHSGSTKKYTSNGRLIADWAEPTGTGDGEFTSGLGLATDPAGSVYLGDLTRIQKFTADGRFLSKFGTGRLSRTYSLATDRSGNVYAGDRNGILKFTSGGRYITRFGRRGGSGNGGFGGGIPEGLATDAAGNVYATDHFNERVQKFGPLPARPRARTCRKPARRTRSRRACFRFRSSQTGVRFQCRLTGRGVPKRLRRFRACTSPKRFRGLKPGRKAFQVRAIRGGVAGRPDKRSWRISK